LRRAELAEKKGHPEERPCLKVLFEKMKPAISFYAMPPTPIAPRPVLMSKIEVGQEWADRLFDKRFP